MKTSIAARILGVALLCVAGCRSITKVSDGQAYVQQITAERLRERLEVIASDSLEGREMATEGERKASAYIAKTFASLELQKPAGTNEYLQGFDVVRDSIDESTLWIDGTEFPLKKYGRAEASLNSTTDLVGDSIVFAGYGIDTEQYSDYKGHHLLLLLLHFDYFQPQRSGRQHAQVRRLHSGHSAGA